MRRLLLFLALLFVPAHDSVEMVVEEFSQEQIEMFQELTTINPEVKKATEPAIILPDTVPLDGDLQVYGQELCYKYKISWSMVLAVLESECSWVWQEGDSGKSVGWMQIRKCNWDRYDGLDVRDPYDNLEIGIRMLAELKEKYGEFDQIIMAYKGGETAMLEWVEEGFRLPCCDELAERAAYWEGELNDTRCR